MTLQASGTSNQVATGVPSSVVVANFSSSNLQALPSDFTADIDWGDGTQAPATNIYWTGFNWSVVGTHTYARNATWVVSVTIRDATDSVVATSSIKSSKSGGWP